MEWLQQIYMWILNPIYGMTAKISDTIRERTLFCIMFLIYALILIWYSINMFGIYISHTPRMLLECILLFAAILCISNKRLEKIKWNNLFAASWILCGIIIFLMGFVARQNLGYWFIGPVMAFGFPCLYFVIINQEEYAKHLTIICKAIVAASLIYFVFAMFVEFISDTVWDSMMLRYNGTTSDANRIGEICVASFVCGISLITMKEVAVRWRLLSLLVMAFCICDAWLSVSRSTILAMGCIVIYYLILTIKQCIVSKNIKKLFVDVICIVCCILIGFMGTFVMKSIHNSAVEFKSSKTEVSAETVPAAEPESVPAGESVTDRLDTQNQDINTFSSGRITIWSTYLDGVGIIGNPADGKTPISDVLTNVAAHNTLLEFSYRSGILAGILFFIVEFLSGIWLLRVLFRCENKNESQHYVTAFAAIGFIMVSNLQVAYNPLTSIIFFVYALSIVTLFDKKNRWFKNTTKKLA